EEVAERDGSHVSWARPVSGNNPQRAAMERIEDVPLVVGPPVRQLRFGRKNVVHPEQIFARIGLVDASKSVIATGTAEVRQRIGLQQRRAVRRDTTGWEKAGGRKQP